MRVRVTSPESDAVAVVEIDRNSGSTTLISGEGEDLELAVRAADKASGGNPPWGSALEAIIQWADSSGNTLEYPEPDWGDAPDGAVY
jgi:hypothetical protein